MSELWLIDLGSSRIKVQIRSPSGAVLHRFEVVWPAGSDEVPLPAGSPARVWISRVGPLHREQALLASIRARYGAVPVEAVRPMADGPTGLRLGYDPTQLGTDRYCALLGVLARSRAPAVVIDAGTAVTVDLLAENGRHLGGYILPGYGLGLASVAGLLTEDLRRGLEPASGAIPDPEAGAGRSTAQALARGWTLGLAAAIERLGSLPRPDGQTDVQWWLTGGDSAWLAELLPRPARVEPDLVLEGLWLAARHDVREVPEGSG